MLIMQLHLKAFRCIKKCAWAVAIAVKLLVSVLREDGKPTYQPTNPYPGSLHTDEPPSVTSQVLFHIHQML